MVKDNILVLKDIKEPIATSTVIGEFEIIPEFLGGSATGYTIYRDTKVVVTVTVKGNGKIKILDPEKQLKNITDTVLIAEGTADIVISESNIYDCFIELKEDASLSIRNSTLINSSYTNQKRTSYGHIITSVVKDTGIKDSILSTVSLFDSHVHDSSLTEISLKFGSIYSHTISRMLFESHISIAEYNIIPSVALMDKINAKYDNMPRYQSHPIVDTKYIVPEGTYIADYKINTRTVTAVKLKDNSVIFKVGCQCGIDAALFIKRAFTTEFNSNQEKHATAVFNMYAEAKDMAPINYVDTPRCRKALAKVLDLKFNTYDDIIDAKHKYIQWLNDITAHIEENRGLKTYYDGTQETTVYDKFKRRIAYFDLIAMCLSDYGCIGGY